MQPVRCGIVLAGGEGRRLQPFVYRLKGVNLPKQYVNFLGSRSMLEMTFERTEKLISPNHLFTVVNQGHWGSENRIISELQRLGRLGQFNGLTEAGLDG